MRILFENEEPRADDAAGSDIAKQVNKNDLSNRYLCHQPTTTNHSTQPQITKITSQQRSRVETARAALVRSRGAGAQLATTRVTRVGARTAHSDDASPHTYALKQI